MRQLWTQEEASFVGQHVKFEKSWAWPKPTQKPYPPIVMGGAAGPKTADHIAEFCDGWMPIDGMYDFDNGLKAVHAACKKRGRDPASVTLGMFFAMPPEGKDPLKGLADKGVTRAIFPVPASAPEVVLPLLDKYAKFI